jgi:Na+/H+-dicarboxylate symporter
VLGSASLDAKMNGKIALRTMGYFVSTSFFNAILGVILVVAIHPGDPSIRGELQAEIKLDERQNTLMDNFLDLGRYLLDRDKHGMLASYLSNVSTKNIFRNNLHPASSFRNIIPSNIFTAMFQQVSLMIL